MAITRRRSDAAATALTTSLQTILTFSAGLVSAGGMLQGVRLVNRSASTRIVTINVYESGGSAGNGNVAWVGTVPANDTVFAPVVAYCDASAVVQAKMDGGTSGDVNAWPVAIEES